MSDVGFLMGCFYWIVALGIFSVVVWVGNDDIESRILAHKKRQENYKRGLKG